jgi:hypothetical protein
MTNAVNTSKATANISRGSMMVAVHALSPNDRIERLKALGCKQDCRAESANMIDKVPDDVKLGLVKPTWGPTNRTIEEMVNG